MRTIQKGLFLVLMTVLFLLNNQVTYGDVFAHYIRVTQPDSELPFDGKFDDGSGAAVRFILSDRADTVWVNVYLGANLVKTIKATNYTAVDTFVVWDGTNNNGQNVGTGSYTFEVKTYNSGYNAYTQIYYDQPAIFTRGVTAVTNPNLKHFGFIYSASNGGYVTGVARHAGNGVQFGDVWGNAQMTTTGAPVGPSDVRFSSEADEDGYVYVLGRTNRQIFRYHTDTMHVVMIDSNGLGANSYNTPLQGLQVTGTGAGKWIFVIGDSSIYGFNIGTNYTWFGPKQLVVSTNGANVNMMDMVLGRDSSAYIPFWVVADAALPGVARIKIQPGVTKTFTDTLWTIRFDGGRGATAAFYRGATNDDDIVYATQARIASGNPPVQGIHAIKNIYTNSPTMSMAYQDLQNNVTTIRSDIAVDAVGNIVYFENSNEEVVLIAPPFGPNQFTTPGRVNIQVVAAEDIAAVKIDANGDRIPDRVGQTVTVVGVVNSINFTASANRFSYYIQDGTGGINITKGSQPNGGPVYNIGDRILVTGTLGHFRGTSQLDIANLTSDISLLGTGVAISPVQLTIPAYLADPEKYEGMFIEIMGVAKTSASPAWPTTSANATLKIYDGYNILDMFVDLDAGLHNNAEPTWPVNVKGIATQYTSSSTVYNDGYQVSPRFYTDFTQGVAVPPSPYFFLDSPSNNASIVVTDSNQTFTAKWNKAVDLNGDNLVYQFILLKTPLYQTSALSDTQFTFTGRQVLTWLAGQDTLKTKWTVRAKGSETTIVASVDTFNITLIKNILVGVKDLVPAEFYVNQNYPNPFNPATTIKFGLPSEASVDLRIFNILGQQVAVLLNNQIMTAGHHNISFDASKLSTGTYIYRLSSGDNVVTKKMILMK
ncbi:MAG TPA: FlgD immunoglobulin-like domain containing protein [Ignavibacteriaceae bacterium]|nr:FlgD immunoglobulin-like domain containing protein [Ignavibacteriaceae bacterium]